ncbi:MAG: hypothetical protein KatS3mg027_2291 [Bacteroidia bacterium]|nr:MAG: hypothetical protein KatS3mg027_2291 [Bacteroidia bacterium]
MKKYTTVFRKLCLLFIISLPLSLLSQIDSLAGFNEQHALEHIKHVVDESQREQFLEQIKRNWIIRKFNLRPYQNLQLNTSKLIGGNNTIQQGPQPAGCTNIDFEAGNTSTWTMLNTSGGSGYFQVVNSGTDMWGNFPRVYPGGNYSLMLGNDWSVGCSCTSSSMGNFCNSTAQRVIPVSAANAQFALHFAFVVYNFPHTPSEAAYVEIKILDQNGNQLPCPYFKVYWDGSSGQFVGLSGATPQFGAMDTRCYTGCSNCNVTYLPWTTVNVDLTPYIGQNVTLQASVNWCVYQVDWAYAYIDADCTNSTFAIPPACAGANICAPAGFASYNWSIPGGGTANTQCITANTPGIYTVVCNPIISCSSPQTVTVSVGGGFTANVTATNVSCYGGSNGSASVSVTGGTAPFNYTWSPTGGNGALATGLSAGQYTVTIQDANCAKTETITISQPPSMTLSIASSSASCSSLGSATVTVTGGGTGPFNYTWNPTGGNASVATGLSTGNFTAIVQDANGCTASATVNVPGTPMPSITSIPTTSVSCNGGSNGSATVNVSSGVAPYTYTWLPTGGNNSSASGLSAGNYTVQVKDANNCLITGTTSILQPPALSITAQQTQSVSCNAGNNGVASATVSGGVGGYSYTWTPSGGNSSTANNLTSGIYTVNVSDANNCLISATVQINQPPALSISVNGQSVSCYGGSNGNATVTASGGVGGYSYTWNPTGGNNTVASNLSSGIYTVYVKDANNCGPISNTVQITQPPALTLNISSQDATCFGYANGSATVNVSGGMGNYTYTWYPSGGSSSVAVGLTAGNYSINVLDINSCFTSTTIVINQPSPVALSTSNYTICYGNNVNLSVNASGGTPPYTYSWMPTGWTASGPYSQTLTATTFYTVYALDANNCSSPVKIVKAFVMPPLLAIGMSTTVCDKEQATIYPSITSIGNGGPYSYYWSNGMNVPSVTVTGNYLTQPNVYTVTIDDGCSIPSATTTCTVYVNPLPRGSFTGDIIKGCAPLLVNFKAVSSGGNSDTYYWNFGNDQSATGNPTSTNYTLAGVYSPTLTIVSQFGCVYDTVATNYIEVYPYPIADFEANPWGTTIVTPTINFINTSYGAVSYLWNFGDYGSPTNTTTIVNPSHEYTYSGTYTVSLIATNQYGCVDYIAKVISIDPEFHLYIPNVFTPDGNGLNDVFQPKGIGIDESDYKMMIFDRWGELIFQSNEFRKGWDGSVKGNEGKATQDVYVYKIYVKDLKGNRHEFVGHVTCLPNKD